MSDKPRVWSQLIRLPDGRVFEVPYLATAEHIKALQDVGLVGEVDEVVGMQEAADAELAQLEKQFHVDAGGMTQ